MSAPIDPDNVYIITGPVDIGGDFNGSPTLVDTRILGNVILEPLTFTQIGQIPYVTVESGDQSGQIEPIPVGTEGQILTLVSDGNSPANLIPQWQDSSSADTGLGFSAFKSGSQVIPGSSVLTNITDWSIADPGYDELAGAFNVTTGVFTVPESGTYQLNAGVTFDQNRNGGSRTFQVYNITNASVIFTHEFQTSGNNAINKIDTISGNVNLTAGDEIVLRFARSNNGGTLSILDGTGETWFGGFRLR